MALSISRALNIEREERGVVLLLLTQSIFLGIFAGALDVGANALFLEAYNADQMPRAFMFSGAAGILFTSIYTFLQKRMNFKVFTVLNLMVAILITGALWMGYQIVDEPWLSFALLVLMGPVIIISMLGFWGTAGRYFSLREGKRLFGIIDTGSVVGMILAFYAVPVLVRFNFKVYDTLLIGLSSLFLALIFQVIFIRRHKLQSVRAVSREKKSRLGYLSIFRKRYTSLMALFVVLSVITAFFVHYSFMWATEESYPDTRELTGFLGAFFGTMMIFTVVIKSTLYGWLMKNYGLRVTLILSPALLLILTVVASVVGGIFGFTEGTLGFTMFFLVIALSKLFNKSLKDAIESPSMKILYQSLDSEERFDVQARIDGVVNEFTAFSAGLIMAGLLVLSFITVIHFSYILIGLLIIWVILGYALNKSYRKTLNDSLASVKSVERQELSQMKMKLPHVGSTDMYRELIELDPYFYHYSEERSIHDLLLSDDIDRQTSGWKLVINSLFIVPEEILENVMENGNNEVRKLAEEYSKRLKKPGKSIDKAFRSSDKNQKLAAIVQTVMEKDSSQIPHLITLLRDRDHQVRSAAIEACGKLGDKELGSYLVDYLGHPELYHITWSALVNIGESILDNLENMFHKAGVGVKVQFRIVRAISKIGGEKAKSLLFNKIDHHQRDTREAAINGLYELGFIPTERQNPKLHSNLFDAVRAGAMNLAAESVIQDNDPGNGLLQAISQEKERSEDLIFKILAITYDKSAIDHVQQSIEDEEGDTGFALEMLNLLVHDEVFAYLEPYFDDLSISEKIKRLQNEMPVDLLNYEDQLIELLNRDSLITGKYLRMCAIDAIGKLDNIDAGRYLAAQAFNPDQLVSQGASSVLAELDAELHSDVVSRMQMSLKEQKTNRTVDLYKDQLVLTGILSEWELFRDLPREELFMLVRDRIPDGVIDPTDATMVSILKSGSQGWDQLDRGLILKISNFLPLVNQIDYLASQSGYGIYQIKEDIFREILFDRTEIRKLCISVFDRELSLEFKDLTMS